MTPQGFQWLCGVVNWFRGVTHTFWSDSAVWNKIESKMKNVFKNCKNFADFSRESQNLWTQFFSERLASFLGKAMFLQFVTYFSQKLQIILIQFFAKILVWSRAVAQTAESDPALWPTPGSRFGIRITPQIWNKNRTIFGKRNWGLDGVDSCKQTELRKSQATVPLS